MLNLKAMTPATRASLERVETGMLKTLTKARKPEVLIFYNYHAPLEPMTEQAQLLARGCNPGEVAIMEYPAGQTPFGYYRRAFDLLEEGARNLAAGTKKIAGISPAAARAISQRLIGFFQTVREDQAPQLAELIEGITVRPMY